MSRTILSLIAQISAEHTSCERIHRECRQTPPGQSGRHASGLDPEHLDDLLLRLLPQRCPVYHRDLTKQQKTAVNNTNNYAYQVVLCDTHDTTILIVDTSRRYRRYLRDDTTAVYRSSEKYRETAKVS